MKKPNIKFDKTLKSKKDLYMIAGSSMVMLALMIVLGAYQMRRSSGSGEQAVQTGAEMSAGEQADPTEIFASIRKEGSEVSGETAGQEAAGDPEDAAGVAEEETPKVWRQNLDEVLTAYDNLGIVSCSGYINFRREPNTLDLTNIIGKLPNGAACNIIENNPEGYAGWALVSSGGMQGYVSNQYLLTGEEAVARVPDLIRERATVVTEKLRMRSAPVIEDGNTIGSAVKGEKYQVIGREGDWLQVISDNLDGYEYAYMSALPENVSVGYGLNEARTMNLRAMVLNMYDNLAVSTAENYVNIRETPEEGDYSNIVGKFPGYAGAELLGEENGWYKIKSGEVTGYVKSEWVATGGAAENLAVEHASLMAIVNTEALNVRSEANLDSEAWTQVTKDQRYNVLDQLDGWVQLELDTGDDADEVQGAYVSTRDNNVQVTYALQEAVEYYPAVEAANAAAAFRNQIVNYACQFVGNPYVWGGTSLTNGADCSGFTQSVLKHFGISIPRVSRDQARAGVRVTSDQMKPGDLVFYANKSGTVNHVGMYIGNGQVVNAASRRSGIRIYAWNYRTPVAIRNVIGD